MEMSQTNSCYQHRVRRAYAVVTPPEFSCEPRFFVFGVAWLVTGFVVYMIARSPTVVAFFPQAPSLAVLLPSSLRLLLGPVPTFVHVLAFSMMSASIVGRTHKRRLFICGVWAVIEIAFELAQYPVISHWLQQCMAGSSMPYVHDYLVHGTFDYKDILAAIIGAAFAGLILTSTRRLQ